MVSQFSRKQQTQNDQNDQNRLNHRKSQSNPQLAQQEHVTIKQSNNDKHNCGCQSLQQKESSSSSLQPYIGTYHEAPQWMRYQQLTIGYRINFSSYKLILKSLFLIHNQTTNVWTHLIGTFLLLLTAMITCTDFVDMFQLSTKHSHLKLYQDVHPIGSGESFVESITQRCIDEGLYLSSLSYNNEGLYLSSLSYNNYHQQSQKSQQKHQPQQSLYTFSQHDKLLFHMCEQQNNPHECYIQKSHKTKLRNWLQFYLGIKLDQIEKLKLIIQKQMVTEFLPTHLQHRQTTFDNNNNNQQDTLARWPLVFYLVCNSICLLCSVTYHLFYPLSQRAHSLCVCTDFAGISVLFGGSAIPCIYYGMYCYFQVGEIYLIGIISASVLVFGLSFTNKFQDRKSSTFRVLIYFVFACFMVTPLFHMTINELIFNNYNDSYSFVSSLQWYVLGLLFFGIGGFFYASQVPNRFSRIGKYDIFGHSHHYWHVFVVLAIGTIYVGCLENYFTRKESTCGGGGMGWDGQGWVGQGRVGQGRVG